MDDVTALESSNEAFSEWQELASEEVEASVEKVTFCMLKGMSLDKEMFISLTETGQMGLNCTSCT